MGQPLRFLVVGAAGYVVNIALFSLLLSIVPYGVSACCSYLVSNALMFLGNRYWTFGRRGRGLGPEYVRYMLVGLLVLGGNLAVLALLVEAFAIPKVPAQALSLLAVTPVAYLANKRWTFHDRVA